VSKTKINFYRNSKKAKHKIST